MAAEKREGIPLSNRIAAAHIVIKILLAIAAGISLGACSNSQSYIEPNAARAEIPPQVEVSDAAIEQRAIASLGDREGTVLVIDPQNSRLRAVVNQRMAFEQTYPPGSAIKPFTALAAMKAGLLERDTKHMCRTRYARGGYEIACSHPRSESPFNLPQALAYSCNDYFGTVGERLSEGAFISVLHQFGFGERLGVSAAESAGSLPRGEWRVDAALGDSDRLLVTPIQMLAAYNALVNGGHLLRPVKSDAAQFAGTELARLNIAPDHRMVLIEGMRGAVKYGTAGKTGLGQIPFYVFGKTGTSESSNGFRTQGWFAGFAAEKPATGVPAPEQIKMGVLVFLRRAHGSQAAEIATAILNCGMRNMDCGKPTEIAGTAQEQPSSAPPLPASRMIKVRSVRENLTREMPIEEYLVGVVSSEASTETELEAMKAQAVASRSYALKNLGRHAEEGYDFCSLTHCQQYIQPNARTRPAFRQAVLETFGEVLRDEAGKPVESFFHAACGGITANIEKLWGAPSPAPAHLRGVRDDFCAAMPNRRWNQAIPADRLRDALNADARTNIGNRLAAITVARRDETGRAESLAIEGEKRRTMRGWDFKIAVGRALGWQMIKSSRFEVERAGAQFIFRGSGFGHGIGLCQSGSHVMAARGMKYQQILQHYFPGVRVAAREGVDRRLGQRTNRRGMISPRRNEEHEDFFLFPSRSSFLRGETTFVSSGPPDRNDIGALQPASYVIDSPQSLTNADGHFDLIGGNDSERKEVLRILEAAYRNYSARFAQANLSVSRESRFEVVIHPTTAAFIASTGLSGWAAGATQGRRIELQPLRLLHKRGILPTTLRHELAHAFLESAGGKNAPRWLLEGIAIHLAGEGPVLSRYNTTPSLSPRSIERELAKGGSRLRMQQLYAAAYQEVVKILRAQGEVGLLRQCLGAKGG